MGPKKMLANKHPKVGERVYSKLGVQTRLNNISESGRLVSTTNTLKETYISYIYALFRINVDKLALKMDNTNSILIIIIEFGFTASR